MDIVLVIIATQLFGYLWGSLVMWNILSRGFALQEAAYQKALADLGRLSEEKETHIKALRSASAGGV